MKSANQKNNLKTKNNNNPPKINSVGFGFADAMFNMKSLEMDYNNLQLQDQPITPISQQNLQPPKPPLKALTKPTKQSNHNKTNSSVQISSNQPQQVFKISAGKQFQKFIILPLIPIKTSQYAYQLTTNNVKTNFDVTQQCQGVSISYVIQNPKISFHFQLTDVKQGGLGDCYLVLAFAGLAHFPQILKQRIPKYKQYTEKSKAYEVNMFQSGKNIKVYVNDRFPQIYIKPMANNISLMILEKAYAQAFGSFCVLNFGHARDALQNLTGAPTQYINIKDKQQLTYNLIQIFNEQYPIIISSKAAVKIPIAPKHSFNILEYKFLQDTIFLKLRDPRGNCLTNFPNLIPLPQQQSLNGIFWVNHQMLVQNFEVITICKLQKQHTYYFKTFTQKQLTNNQCSLLLKISQKGYFTFTSHQKNKKFFNDKHQYQMLRILLAKITKQNGKIVPLKTIASNFKVQHVCSISTYLDQGQYILLSQIGINNKKPPLQNQALTISIYTSLTNQQSINFQFLKGTIPIHKFIKQYICNHKSQFKQSISDKKLQRYFGPFYGYLCMYLDNQSGKSVIQSYDYTVENITISQKKISLQPGESKLIMHPIGEKNNSSHKIAFKTQTLYK